MQAWAEFSWGVLARSILTDCASPYCCRRFRQAGAVMLCWMLAVSAAHASNLSGFRRPRQNGAGKLRAAIAPILSTSRGTSS